MLLLLLLLTHDLQYRPAVKGNTIALALVDECQDKGNTGLITLA